MNKWHSNKQQSGVTLLEIILVLVVMSAILIMSIGYLQQRTNGMRIDRTATQMQEILNAGMAYHVTTGQWPYDISQLLIAGFLTSTPISPWAGVFYSITHDDKNLYVYTTITLATNGAAGVNAKVIAGKLPFAYISNGIAPAPVAGHLLAPANAGTPPSESTCPGTTCYVVSYVNMPGSTFDGSVNFGGLYHHGACVPVPLCTVDDSGATAKPSVFIIPISVSGVNDAGSTGSTEVYPISSFTGYATGGTDTSPPKCDNSTDFQTDCTQNSNGPTSTAYWRACLDLITERGAMNQQPGGNDWGQYVTLLAVTRCSSTTEATGSSFSVYSN
jgi:type II secretory pathway pseudopilin PulG